MESQKSLLKEQPKSIAERAIQYAKGVGPKLGDLMSSLGIYTFQDFVFNVPRAYDDRRQLKKIAQLKVGETQGLIVKILSCTEKKVRGLRSLLEAQCQDETGVINAVWFNQGFMKRLLTAGNYVYLKGKVDLNEFSMSKVLKVSETEKFMPNDSEKVFGKMMPIYPLTAGLQQYQMRRIAKVIVPQVLADLIDPLPLALKQSQNLLDKKQALFNLHFPSDDKILAASKRRIIFEEFLVYQCRLLQRQSQMKRKKGALRLKCHGPLWQQYSQGLPYQLTQGQLTAMQDIARDLSQDAAMNRLVQGDVGCGKTEVAMMALLAALDSGKVAAFMAPTQILAEQHYLKLKRLEQSLGIEVFLLKGQQRKKEKEATKAYLKNAKACIVVGTHALIESDVDIPNLALLVIDEQHRFGVMQRLKLQEKGQVPHALYMTATPIPRSFMLTCFGDLDKSLITTMPKGRQAVSTFLAKESSLDRVLAACKKECQAGRQLYVVYPLVDESETLDLKSAIEGQKELDSLFNPLKVGLLHGKMTPDEKAQVMSAFRAAKIQVLVSTTVIEVGVDVPNASMMVIMHADRFGLSQLHQLRGRVGRGQNASQCYLIANPKNPQSKKRIKAMLDHHNGFKIAQIDLEIRGPGDMLGTKQSGLPDFKLADILRDEAQLLAARDAAKVLIEQDPDLNQPQHRYLKTLVLAEQQQITKNNLN